MEQITAFLELIDGTVLWGPPMLALILGTGLYLTIRLRAITVRNIGTGFRELFKGRAARGAGDITPFNALMTALAATVGTGNIAGVATAVFLGGPGALFWMWCTALVGMATKFSEAVLAVKFREGNETDGYRGGPMYYIKNGLGEKYKPLAFAFAFFAAFASFGIGNTVQANSVADAMLSGFAVPVWITGVIMAILAALVILGGIKVLGEVAGRLVPLMAVLYVGAGLVILALNAAELPAAIGMVFTYAFTPAAATGGFAGAAVWAAIRFGVARGVFSNEAGLGSAPIAHAAAKNNSPVGQGLVAMLGTFIDTIIICSITGFVIIISGEWTSGLTGAALSSAAFESALPGFGGMITALGLALFAFTTILGWSYYGEKSVEFLLGHKAVLPFRLLWIAAIPLGAMAELNFIWLLADILNALMAIPNLIALLLLSPVVVALTKSYFEKKPA